MATKKKPAKSTKKSAKSTTKPAKAPKAAKAAPASGTFDNRTRAGRAALDKAVLAQLNKTPVGRGAIAKALAVAPLVASASLKRLAADGKATVTGHHGLSRYAKA